MDTWLAHLRGGILKIAARIFVIILVLSMSGAAEPQQDKGGAGSPPAWAYPVNPPDDRPAPDDGTPMHVPGSSKALTRTQALDGFNVPDWHPDGHPPMPSIVEH